ncbi:hypothetical protein, conserved [Eimeria brunetti]|uniref:mRNA 5'-phosphatase n=1 Tax=Eimeria brunetti TaxID=51314 RepID=U6LVF3_9EIME|nr:hypothetical protein, conserved [Eimeria brunetti]
MQEENPSQQLHAQSTRISEPVPRGPLPASALVLAEALDASFCPLVDELAQQLVQQLLLLHEEHPSLFQTVQGAPAGGPPGAPSAGGPPFSLELEGRLGVLLERDRGSRIRLPPGGGEEGGPQARFAAGVSAAHFAELKELLLRVAAGSSSAAAACMQQHLALMGMGPALELPEDSEKCSKKENTIPHISGDDWQVLPEVETEENYYHIPALQAPARFSSKLVPGGSQGGPPGAPRGPPPYHGGPFMGGPVSIQGLGQVLMSPGIYKKNLLQWNVYTGADKEDAFASTDEWGPPSGAPDDTAERTRVDYRLAINFEHKIEVKDLQKSLMQMACGGRGGPGPPPGYPGGPPGSMGNNTEPQLRRRRLRQSLVHRSGLRVDLTKVQQQQKPTGGGPRADSKREAPGRWQYEVELELHPKQIAKAS